MSNLFSATKNLLNKIHVRWVVIFAIAITAYAYVVINTWSPSSYGLVFNKILHIQNTGTVGEPRAIRSDEWGVVTPLTQAIVNNNYERFNHTSLYEEDLRINYGLPIHDWGLIFKPTMWLYGWVNPAYAYSAHWFALMILFICGYAFLFRWLGASAPVGFALSIALFSTGFVQFWWNEKGALFAIFPWILFPFSRNWPFYLKSIIFYWVATCWLLLNFYPPIQVSLAFVGFIILYGKEKSLFRLDKPLLMASAAAAAAAGTAAFYLWDYLRITAGTLYPGGRHVMGGGIPWEFFISWFLPAINFTDKYESLIGRNICEIGVVGSYYFLLCVLFLNYQNVKEVYVDSAKKHLAMTLLIGLMLMSAWLFLPLPSWMGTPLLWDNVQPERMQYAFGVLLFCFFLILVNDLGVIFSWLRLGLFTSLCLALMFFSTNIPLTNSYHFLSLVVLLSMVWALFFLNKKYTISTHFGFAFAACAIGAAIFMRFNALQSAWPIFNLESNAVTKRFDEMASYNNGVLAVIGLPGAVGNGLGYKSLSHVLAAPQINFWKEIFPEMKSDDLNRVFNRYAHIMPTETNIPELIQLDLVSIPVNSLNKVIPVRYVQDVYVPIQLGGYVDRVVLDGKYLIVDGWAPWFGSMGTRQLEIMISSNSGKAVALAVNRPDLPAATGGVIRGVNGFNLKIPHDPHSLPTFLCVISYDVSSGKRYLLNNPANIPYCPVKQK
jgi:hypothetical protein